MRRALVTIDVAAFVFAAIGLAGLVVLGLAWYGVSGTRNVADEIPYVVSGGFGGLALTVTGSLLLVEHVGRRLAADENDVTERVSELLARVADDRRR
jgi:hypothetical protein